MKTLAAGCVTDEMMRTLWMNHLPLTLRSIISATDALDLEKMAELADRIHDFSSGPTVMATHISAPTSSIENKLHELTGKFEALLRGFSQLATRVNRLNNPRNRSREKTSHG